MTDDFDVEFEAFCERYSIHQKTKEERKSGALGFEVTLILSFVIGQFTGALLSEAAHEFWSTLKKATKRIYKLEKEKRSGNFEIEIVIPNYEDGKTLRIVGKFDSEKEVDMCFEDLIIIGKLIGDKNADIAQEHFDNVIVIVTEE